MKISDIHEATATLPPRILIYGQEGVGKTSLAAKFPAPVFLLAEDGIPSGIKVASLGGWLESYASVQAGLVALASEPHKFQTVVIDALDPLEALIWRDVSAFARLGSRSKVRVSGKATLRPTLGGATFLPDLITCADERGMLVVLIAHVRSRLSATPARLRTLRINYACTSVAVEWCRIGSTRSASSRRTCTSRPKTQASKEARTRRWRFAALAALGRASGVHRKESLRPTGKDASDG